MIHTELPATNPSKLRTYKKKHTTVITPEKILLNEKLMLGLIFSGVALTFTTWALRKGKK